MTGRLGHRPREFGPPSRWAVARADRQEAGRAAVRRRPWCSRRWRRLRLSAAVCPWEDLIARALASPPPYRPVPGDPVYHLRVDEQVVLVAEHDLSGSLYDLVTAVLALGDALH